MPGCGKKDIDFAVDVAKEAQVKWAEISGFEKMKILRNAATLLKAGIIVFFFSILAILN